VTIIGSLLGWRRNHRDLLFLLGKQKPDYLLTLLGYGGEPRLYCVVARIREKIQNISWRCSTKERNDDRTNIQLDGKGVPERRWMYEIDKMQELR
jgi:hypothetical protein